MGGGISQSHCRMYVYIETLLLSLQKWAYNLGKLQISGTSFEMLFLGVKHVEKLLFYSKQSWEMGNGISHVRHGPLAKEVEWLPDSDFLFDFRFSIFDFC